MCSVMRQGTTDYKIYLFFCICFCFMLSSLFPPFFSVLFIFWRVSAFHYLNFYAHSDSAQPTERNYGIGDLATHTHTHAYAPKNRVMLLLIHLCQTLALKIDIFARDLCLFIRKIGYILGGNRIYKIKSVFISHC